MTKKDQGFLGAQGNTQERGGGEQEEGTLKDGLTLLGEGDSVFLPSKALNESSFRDPFQYALLEPMLTHAHPYRSLAHPKPMGMGGHGYGMGT